MKKTIEHKIEAEDFRADPGFVSGLKNESEKAHNAKALSAFDKWSKPKTREWESADVEGQWDFAEHQISLRSKPNFKTIEKGEAFLHVVYASSASSLGQSVAGLGCFALKKMFEGTKFGNCRFCILDLSQGRRFSDKQAPKNPEGMLEHEVASFARMVRTISSR